MSIVAASSTTHLVDALECISSWIMKVSSAAGANKNYLVLMFLSQTFQIAIGSRAVQIRIV